MSGILQKNAEGEQPLSVEGERQRLIWNSLYHLPHAKISAIQQVIRNAKKTWGKWEYLGVKVTLGPPSVGAYALCVHLSAWQISPNAAVLLFFDFFIPSPTSTAALCSPLIHLESDHITSFCSGCCTFSPLHIVGWELSTCWCEKMRTVLALLT